MLGPLPPEEVRNAPFPHVIMDGWLESGLYTRLARKFPVCPPNTGPTGYTLFQGDPTYDRLVADDPDWAQFYRAFHSQGFIDQVLRLFDDTFAEAATVDLADARYVPYCESRTDKQRLSLSRIEHAPDELWVRVDIMQGLPGYQREAHLDHRRRAVSLLVYFCDADENAMEGGDLVLHGVECVTEVRPRHNRMVVFPCHDGSLHSVSRIRSQNAPRNFVQVTVSSSVDMWKGTSAKAPSWPQRARHRLQRLTRRSHSA